MSSPHIPSSSKRGAQAKSVRPAIGAQRKAPLFGLVLFIASILLLWFYLGQSGEKLAQTVPLDAAPQPIAPMGSPVLDESDRNMAPPLENGGESIKGSEVDTLDRPSNSAQGLVSDAAPRSESPLPRLELELNEIPRQPADAYVRISGANVVASITAAVAAEFHNQMNGKARVVMGSTGTPAGFIRLCRGESDIVHASRPILRNEMQRCAAAGIKYFEVPVAYEAIAVVANHSESWLDRMTVNELKSIWAPASQGLTKWNAINPKWPNQDLLLIGANRESMAYEFFTSAVTGVSWSSRLDFTASTDGSIFSLWLNQSPGTLGFIKYSTYASRTDKMKGLKIVNGDGQAVAPTLTTILDGSYHPLGRPLFVYVSSKNLERPEVQEFVALYLSKGIQFVEQGGHVPLTENTYSSTLDYFREKKLGTVFGGVSTLRINAEEAIHREREL